MTSIAARFVAAVAAFAVVTAISAVEPRLAQEPADLVLRNGKIVTVDARDTIAQAVAIRAGKIMAVGSDDEIKSSVGSRTQVIDLQGRTATPGLIDIHVHFSAADRLYTLDVGDPAITSISDVLARVRESVAKRKPGEWVVGRGWDEGKFAERRYITAADLDRVAPNNPVYLTQTTGHYGVANTYALKIAEINGNSKDPPAGTIDRDASGRPTGVVKERAQQLVTRHIPPLTREQQKAGILKIMEEFNKEGMTGAKDPGIGAEKWALYQELAKQGQLTTRVHALWRVRSLDDATAFMTQLKALPHPQAWLADGGLSLGGVKLAMDGSGGARTAWMHEDWNKEFTGKDSGNAGYPVTEPRLYQDIVRQLHNAGVHVSTHAIGDRAIDFVVDTYDAALKSKPTRGLRHGIIHANTPTDHANEVMARLQKEYDAGYPEASASFMWWIGDTYAANLGPQRAPRLKPLQTWRRKGIKWAGGSDYGVTPFPARYGLWASVARETLYGVHGATPFGTAEAIDIKTALKSFTIWAAQQMFLEDRIGSIEVGKDADIAVWDRDLYSVPTANLKDLVCELTLFRGKVVYRAANTPIRILSGH
jgi:predicted amidohydrolase YtcJ